MVKARLLEGDRPGTVVEAAAEVVQQWLLTGKAELVAAEKPETPERPSVASKRRVPRPETR